MPSAARVVAFALLAAGVARAQPEPDAKDLRQKFLAEREAALKAKFPADTFARADDLAKRADAALAADNPKAAARYFRDARWQLPYLPPGLPEHVVRVLGESRLRHAARVNALAFSPDGARLASCSVDGTVRVWDLANGREVSAYRGHADQPDDPTKGGTLPAGGGTNPLGVADVKFHPKNAKLVVSAAGNQVHVWDADTGKAAKTLLHLGKTDKPVKALAFSPDGKSLAVGVDDGILRVIDSDSGKATFTSPPRTRIETVAFSPNGKLVAVGDVNSFVAVYAPGAANPLAMTAQVLPAGEVLGVAFTADSGAVFSAGNDVKARLTAGPKPDGSTAGNTSTLLREFAGHTAKVTGLAVLGDGKQLVSGSLDKSVRVWDVESGKQLRMFQGHLSGVTAVAARPDGRQVASAAEDGSVRLWDVSSEDDHRALTDATDSLWAVAFAPDGRRVAAAGADKNVRVYNPDTGKLEATLAGAKSPVTSLAFLADSNRLVAAGGDQVVVVWDVGKQKALKEFDGHESAVLSVAASGDGKLVVSGSADKTARGFDPEAGGLWTWSARSAVCAVAVRKGNRVIAAGLADGSLATVDVGGKTPKETSSQSAHVAGVACVAFSPDGGRLASVGGDGHLRVWTVADNGLLTPLARFDGPVKPGGVFTPLTGVAFSPDGRYVAACGSDHVVRVWDVQTKTEVRGLRGHADWVTAVAFSPDGRFVASVGAEEDRAVRVFELPPLEASGGGGHAHGVNAVAVSPNGRFAATAATDQTIKVWDLATGREVATLVGNADTPLALAFVGNESLVMGGREPLGITGRLHFWGTNPGRLTRSVVTSEVYAVGVSPDGSRVAAWVARQAVGATVKNFSYEVYDAKSGEKVTTIADKGREVAAAVFTADAAWAVSGDKGGSVRFWDLQKKETVGGDFAILNSILDLGVSPDKKTLVAADEQGVVKVADISDHAKRNVVGSFTPHRAGVRTLVVSPTGTTVMTVGNDRELKLWSLAAAALKDAKPLRTWSFPVGVNGLAYTPDGKRVVTANADGTAYVLELP